MEPQINAIIMPALLRETACVDTQKTKSLCCAAAGIISISSAATDLQTPHDRLRQAAPPDTTLIASYRSPAQHVKGYTHLPFYAPTSKEQAACNCIVNTIYSTLLGNAAGALATAEQMALAIRAALQHAGFLIQADEPNQALRSHLDELLVNREASNATQYLPPTADA